MGVGKSTVGKKLASRLGYEFIDTDKVFESKYKVCINDFFEKYGEALFRKLEHEILESTFNISNCVISTGGGLPCYRDSMHQINENGISIFLKMNESAIYSRLKASRQKRPLVIKLDDNELKEFISYKLTERTEYYNKAGIVIPALSVDINHIIQEIHSINSLMS